MNYTTTEFTDCEGNRLTLCWTSVPGWGECYIDITPGNGNGLPYDDDFIAKWDFGLYEHVWNHADALGINIGHLEKCNSDLKVLLRQLIEHSKADLVSALNGVGFDDAESLIDEVLDV
jgi:hypothetical protein